jgi:transcriptional regulator with XRE-family HTH domain
MNNIIGDSIRKFRELRGYSQDYMAHKLEISQGSYAKIENGSTNITVDRLQKIAEILEIDIINLLNNSKQNTFYQSNNNNSNLGHIENLYQTNYEAYEKIITTLEKKHPTPPRRNPIFTRVIKQKVINFHSFATVSPIKKFLFY